MRYLSYAFIFLSVCFSIFTVGRILLTFSLYDFVTGYYPALQDLLGGRGLYKNPVLDINYPPTAFLFLLPFGIINPIISQKLWTLFSYASLIGSLLILLKSIGKLTIYNFLFTYSFAMLSFPVKFTLGMGQINLSILLLVCLSFYFYSWKRDAKAGIFLGIAVAIKVLPVVVLLFFIRKKRWKILSSFCITLCIVILLTGLLFGWDLFRQYIFEVVPTIPTIGNSVYYNQAFTGFLARLGGPIATSWLFNTLVFGIFLISGFTSTRDQSVFKSERDLMEYGLFIAASLIGSGLAWQHHFVLLIIPFVALFYQRKKTNIKYKLLILFAYMLVALNIKTPHAFTGVAVNLLSHVLYGTVLVWILLLSGTMQQNTRSLERLKK